MLVIQIIRAVWQELSSLPLLVRIGLAFMPVAFLGDVAVHLLPAAHQHHAGFAPQEHIAHLLGILAMVLVISGVIFDGVRRHRSRRRNLHATR